MIRTHIEYVVQGRPFTLRDTDEFRSWTYAWGLRFDTLPGNQAGIFTPGVDAWDAGIATEDPGQQDRASAGFAAVLQSQSLFHTHGIIELLVAPHLIAELLHTASAPRRPALRIEIPPAIHGRWHRRLPLNRGMFPTLATIEVQVSGEGAPRTLTLSDLPTGEITSPISEILTFASDNTHEIVIQEIQHERHFDVTRFEAYTDRDFDAARHALESDGYRSPRYNPSDLALRQLARTCCWIGRVAARTLTIRRDDTWSLETHQDSATDPIN